MLFRSDTVDNVPIARQSSSSPQDLGWSVITPNRLKLGRNSHRQLEGPIRLDNCPQTQLEQHQLLTARWYELFIERIHLLVPPPATAPGRQILVGDVVLFVSTDTQNKKLWVWKLGKVVAIVSRSVVEILHDIPKKGTTSTLRRSMR